MSEIYACLPACLFSLGRIVSLDMRQWREFVRIFGMKEPMVDADGGVGVVVGVLVGVNGSSVNDSMKRSSTGIDVSVIGLIHCTAMTQYSDRGNWEKQWIQPYHYSIP